MLGSGAYGHVVSGTRTLPGNRPERVAIKKIAHWDRDLQDGLRVVRETKLLLHLSGHECILQLLDVVAPPSLAAFDDCYLVTAAADTDMHKIIQSHQPLSDQHHAYMCYQLL